MRCTFVLSVFRSALPGLGRDVWGGHGSWQEQRCCQQLHQAAILSQTQPSWHGWYLGRGEENRRSCRLLFFFFNVHSNSDTLNFTLRATPKSFAGLLFGGHYKPTLIVLFESYWSAVEEMFFMKGKALMAKIIDPYVKYLLKFSCSWSYSWQVSCFKTRLFMLTASVLLTG